MTGSHRSATLCIALAALLVTAGCTGSASQSQAPPPPTSSPPLAVAETPAPTVTPLPTPAPTAAPTAGPDLMLVAVGDSIPFNSQKDCPGCTGFVNRYADALAAATGNTVGVRNLSQHNGLQVQGLLDGLGDGREQATALADADAIIVGIAHNDIPWNVDDDACDGANGDDIDWSKYTPACFAIEVKRYTPIYDAVFKRIAELRAGKPTILRAINRYNDWNGWPGHPETTESDGIVASAAVIAAWNTMICGAAEANGFTCADISTTFNGADGTHPSGDLLAGDYTHPSDKGNESIADALAAIGFKPLVP